MVYSYPTKKALIWVTVNYQWDTDLDPNLCNVKNVENTSQLRDYF